MCILKVFLQAYKIIPKTFYDPGIFQRNSRLVFDPSTIDMYPCLRGFPAIERLRI